MICHENGCEKRAIYAQKDGEKPTHCPKHGRKKGFINVVSKRCLEDGCTKQPIFGPKYGEKPTHCSDHGKKQGFIDVVNRRCLEDGCTKQPNFGPKYGEKPTHCFDHGKKQGFIDVVGKRCLEDGCTTRPMFGPKYGEKPTHCATHGKKKNFIDVVSKRCKEDTCDITANFGPINGKAEYCSYHKKKDFVDVVHKRCVSESCAEYKNHDKFFASKINPTNGKMELCYICWTAMFPDLNPRKIRKEHFILAEVQRQIPELEEYFLAWDCKIPGQSCVAFRPDMAWIICDTLLHIEIDEYGSEHEDDDHRISEIHSASNKKNHVCIRFNPDKGSDGSPPCLKKVQLSTGESVYNKNPKEWDKRMNILIPEIRNAYRSALENESVCGKRKLCF